MGSLWGQHCRCQNCRFSFNSDHAHSVEGLEPPFKGVLPAICVKCLQQYALPTASPWGAAEGEVLELCTFIFTSHSKGKKKRLQKTVRSLKCFDTFVEFSSEWRVTKSVPGLSCPECKAVDSIVIDFTDGQACPKCGEARLTCEQ